MFWGSIVAFIAIFACRQIPSLVIHHVLFDKMKKRPDCLVKLRNGENLDCSAYFTKVKKISKVLKHMFKTAGVSGTLEKLNGKHLLKSLLDKTSCTINSGKRGKRAQVKKQPKAQIEGSSRREKVM